ncbi:MAG: elongation factor G [Proteobacteria bacterium]|nr:elongation factor G [Pseudomonadota bacterium]
MKVYTSDKIRNIALLGHGGSGKTMLAEAMIHATGATNRLGRIEDGTTVSDWDEEEIKRTQSINSSLIPCEWKNNKINILDTPGYPDFVGEVISALRVTEVGLVVVDAVSGVEVGTELAWQQLDLASKPRCIFINKLDRDNANFERALNSIREAFEGNFVPLMLPVGAESNFSGVVSVVDGKAYLGAEGKTGDVPSDLADSLEEANLALIEAAAESDDDLLMKYLEGEELTPSEIADGLKAAIKQGVVIPVLCGSAVAEIGVSATMDLLLSMVPSPADAGPYPAMIDGEATEISGTSDEPITALVFKTIADPFVGRITLFRVFSGVMQSDARLYNAKKRSDERMGQVFSLQGKEQINVSAVNTGDIAAAAKLNATVTGDTLAVKGSSTLLPPPTFPNPLYSVAVSPATQADSAKIGGALNRLVEEDPTLSWHNEPSTRQMLFSGMGDVHMTIAVNRMQSKFGVNVTTDMPKVPYHETVSRTASASYRHKKQTGGAGQFGEVHLRVERGEEGSGLTYEWEVFGGAVSTSYRPSIEKGIRQVLDGGVIAGYPVVDVLVAVYDGKEHSVDSKDIAFQIAGREAFKKAFMDAGPVFLEPIHKVEVTVPETYMGDILGDLNTRRARVQGMDTVRGKSVITAEVPFAELLRYANDLRSMTQGRGVYAVELLRYETVPQHLAQPIVDAARREKEEQN